MSIFLKIVRKLMLIRICCILYSGNYFWRITNKCITVFIIRVYDDFRIIWKQMLLHNNKAKNS